MSFQLPPIEAVANDALRAQLQHKIDHKTKPLGALGRVEQLALQVGLIQGRESPALNQPQMLVFAADHGISKEGVSAYPSSVTAQMVANMRAGGAAVNVLARQLGFEMTLVNAGVASNLLHVPPDPRVAWLDWPVALGTANSATGPAMSIAQAHHSLAQGGRAAAQLAGNVLAVGDMGIGNSSAAALLLARLGHLPIEQAVGRGTGLNDAQLAHKQAVLARALSRRPDLVAPIDALADLGGFEIGMMTGAMLQAASERRVLMIDGFIAGAALLVARGLCPQVLDYCVFSHTSAEQGTQAMLNALNAKPLLDLGLRLGEGTGALMAYPLVQAACALMSEMASFESAQVSRAH